MNNRFSRDPYYTTAFGMALDHEIADAMRANMPLELICAELAARVSAVTEHLLAQRRVNPPPRDAEEPSS